MLLARDGLQVNAASLAAVKQLMDQYETDLKRLVSTMRYREACTDAEAREG